MLKKLLLGCLLCLLLPSAPAKGQVSGEISAGGQSMKLRFAFATFRSPGYLYVLMLPYQPEPERVKAAVEGASLVLPGKPYAELHVWFKSNQPEARNVSYANMAIYGLPGPSSDGTATVDYKWQGADIARYLPNLGVSASRLVVSSASNSASRPVNSEQPVARWSFKLAIPVKDLR